MMLDEYRKNEPRFGGEQQRSFEWYRRRLGFITGSKVGVLMGTGRTKGAAFSQTAEKYFDELASQRCINKRVYTDDNALQEYLYYNGIIENRAMQYGTLYEDEARRVFADEIGIEVNAEVGSCRHESIEWFAASPDGLFNDFAGNLVSIEIKVPKEETFAGYASHIFCADDLKRIKPDYYWQILASQACINADYSFFITYSRFTEPYLYAVRIDRNEDDIALLEARVEAANAQISQQVAKLMSPQSIMLYQEKIERVQRQQIVI